MGAAFVDKDELGGIELGSCLPPGRARFLVTLTGCQCLFLCVQPRRRTVRHIVASLSCWPGVPCCSAHQAQCSSTVASGAACSRANRSASCLLRTTDRTGAARTRSVLQGAGRALLHYRPFHRGDSHFKAASDCSHGQTVGHHWPPRAPSVLSDRSNRHACPSGSHIPCLHLPLLFASCSKLTF